MNLLFEYIIYIQKVKDIILYQKILKE